MPELFDKLNAEAADEARVIMFPTEPVQENVPLNVWVVPAVKVTVCGAVKVKLLKVVLPEIACVAPFKTTAPAPEPVTVLPLPAQFPATFRAYVPPAIVPAVCVRLPATVVVPPNVLVPLPEIVRFA